MMLHTEANQIQIPHWLWCWRRWQGVAQRKRRRDGGLDVKSERVRKPQKAWNQGILKILPLNGRYLWNPFLFAFKSDWPQQKHTWRLQKRFLPYWDCRFVGKSRMRVGIHLEECYIKYRQKCIEFANVRDYSRFARWITALKRPALVIHIIRIRKTTLPSSAVLRLWAGW